LSIVRTVRNGSHNLSFATLLHFSCAHYVKHLVKVTTEKEKAVQQARCDLEAKRSKIEDDKAQVDRSDPESTTSTLTVSSSSAAENADPKGSSAARDGKKRAASEDSKVEKAAKKPRFETHVSSISSSASSGGDDSDKRPVGVKSRIGTDQTMASVSDMTESNKDSSSDSNASPRRTRSSTASLSSDAAVANRGKGGFEKKLADVLVRNRRSSLDLVSLAPDFEIDYEEGFVKSNVPPCLATTAGKIISCK